MIQTHLTHLDNGLRVASCRIPGAQTASVAIWAAAGGRHEPARLNGVSHFIEHMLFKGTQKRSARRIVEAVEGVGGDINAYTSEERTCYYASAAAEFFPRLCDVLCDFYASPRFAPAEIERERDVISEEIQMYHDEASSHVHDMLNAAFWPRHALGRPVTGTLESVSAISRDDLLEYRSARYHAGSTILTAAGAIEHADLVRHASRYLSHLTRKPKPRLRPAPRPPARPVSISQVRDTQQTQLAIGLPFPGLSNPARFAAYLAQIILGGNASSRLFQEIREKRGLCYSVHTHPNPLSDTGMLTISVGLDGRNLEKCLGLIRRQIDRLRADPPRPSEIRRAREYSIGVSRMELERTSVQNMRLGSSILTYGRIIDPESIHRQIRMISADEIRTAAERFFDPRSATISVIGPTPEARVAEQIFS